MSVQVLQGDCRTVLASLPSESVHTCVTSPPYYGLRDYGDPGQIGLEETPQAYVDRLVEVFREVRRVLRNDGTLWLNLGDSYVGSASTGGVGKETAYTGPRRLPHKSALGLKPKDLIGIPWMVAFALRADGWYLRSDIIWHKPNPMPESVTDRPTKAHEYIFLLAKSERYYYDADAIAEPIVRGSAGSTFDKGKTGVNGLGRVSLLPRQERDVRNKRTVWTVNPQPYPDAHFATYPPKLIEPCILAGSPVGGTVLDPFAGSGTTLAVAVKHRRNAIGIELNPEYCELIEKRLRGVQVTLPLEDAAS